MSARIEIETIRAMPQEDVERLRRRTPGDIALEILAALEEKNMIVWHNRSRYQSSVEFFGIYTHASSTELSVVKLLKAREALIALLKRGYIEPITSEVTVELLNISAEKQGLQKYRNESNAFRVGIDRELKAHPWSTRSQIFTITPLGRHYLAGVQGRLGRIREEERKVQERPQFLITKRFDNQGRLNQGVCKIYRVLKVAQSKVIVQTDDDEALPEMRWADAALCYEGNAYGHNRVAYVNKEHIALMPATLEQFKELRDATNRMDRQVEAARQLMLQKMAPIQEVFNEARLRSIETVQGMIEDMVEQNKNDGDRVDIESEEGFVMDEEDLAQGLGI